MPTTAPFETLTDEYDAWFESNSDAYRAELAALERLLPEKIGSIDDEDDATGPTTLEVGVGTGRFAGPLGIPVGIDPAANPLSEARERGVEPIRGVAERLPVRDGALERVLFVTVWCFLDDLERTLAETRRVLAVDGELVVAFLDRSSPLGQGYQATKDESPFYADAQFVTGEEVCAALEDAGFVVRDRLQTVFDESSGDGPDGDGLDGDEPGGDELAAEPTATGRVRSGHGDGLFGVVRATLE
ncbi:class I SAM-dependent methyltransferase [Halostagnicola kamekurae]|uniref:Methyltransferase domain-containing protein n=1 Tax=Halostagnicola kamekurae TaxID=619731 RepID=A0A1I6RJB5_9EURY|nr:class I SAM-dependent methyltransferase [Halostagnicola kamekurae]SFS64568.1 Methyltransferase domain-containing protein [Halostagnicola kamekurae]